MRRLLVVFALMHLLIAAPARAAGTWSWPVSGAVIRGFDPPDSPYGSGHRGIDIAAASGTPVLAAADGTVSFAGKVGGQLFITIQHGGGLASTYSWVSALSVRKNDTVSAGQPIGLSGQGHPGSAIQHLHFAVKLSGGYVDPLDYLAPGSVVDLIRLAPV